jgi:hypothetical protein
LSDGAKTTGCNLLGVQLNRVLGEVEPLLDNGGQLTDPPALLTEDVLGAGGHDDDLSLGGGNTDLHTGVTILGEFTSQKLVQLSLENSVGDELKHKKNWVINRQMAKYRHGNVFRPLKRRIKVRCSGNLTIYLPLLRNSSHFDDNFTGKGRVDGSKQKLQEYWGVAKTIFERSFFSRKKPLFILSTFRLFLKPPLNLFLILTIFLYIFRSPFFVIQ